MRVRRWSHSCMKQPFVVFPSPAGRWHVRRLRVKQLGSSRARPSPLVLLMSSAILLHPPFSSFDVWLALRSSAAQRRVAEGAAMLRTKGEAGTGNVVEAVRHARAVQKEIRMVREGGVCWRSF